MGVGSKEWCFDCRICCRAYTGQGNYESTQGSGHDGGTSTTIELLVDYVSFSAHVDFVQNRSFIQQVSPKHIILVHGQKDEMGRLKSALLLQYRQLPENKRPTITMPPNLQEVKLKFAVDGPPR